MPRDGTFLDALAADGLLAAGKVGRTAAQSTGEPAQFRTRYRLTEEGRRAAEYGEYERPHAPPSGPVKGLAAVFEPYAAGGNGPPGDPAAGPKKARKR